MSDLVIEMCVCGLLPRHKPQMKTEWDVESAIATYNVDGWGRGYFTINGSGNVEARPLQENGGCIDLLEVVNEARNRGLGFPLVIRLQDLLRHRVESDIGIRVRLDSKGSGKWSPSGGENAKFGLDTTNLIAASQMLKDAGLTHCLKLVHFHVGSQVPDISTIRRAVREAARYYAKLAKLGYELGYLDVGGGLGVDYDGSRSDFDSSTNYSLQEYANDVVWNIMDVCDSEGVVHPAIVSEGGRAIVAHHSVLVMEAFTSIERTAPKLKVEATEKDHKLVGDILDVKQRLKRGNRIESLHDSQQIKEESQQMFDLGLLDLESKAKIETVYWQLAQQIVNMHRGLRFVPEEVKQLEISLGDQYICNFSIFQSLLDHWALGQLFPIMPIHRLTTPPDRNGMIVDITCDSDGKIAKFIDLQDVKETLPLHRISPGEMYYIGVFMVGAYQDIMGDLHNLFGRVTEVHVFLDPDEESGWYIEEVIEGSTIGEVLAMTQWDKVELMRLLKSDVDAAIKSDRLKPNDAMKLLADYERLLQEYTYLSFNGAKLPPPGNWLPLS